MPHHGSNPDPDLVRRLNQLMANEPGPTGQYPQGKYTEHDEGEITYRVAADVKEQKVIVDFGSPVVWIAFDYDSAMALSEALQKKAWQLRGIA
jgi:hypothetical protein